LTNQIRRQTHRCLCGGRVVRGVAALLVAAEVVLRGGPAQLEGLQARRAMHGSGGGSGSGQVPRKPIGAAAIWTERLDALIQRVLTQIRGTLALHTLWMVGIQTPVFSLAFHEKCPFSAYCDAHGALMKKLCIE
jgi:hypothetical protein